MRLMTGMQTLRWAEFEAADRTGVPIAVKQTTTLELANLNSRTKCADGVNEEGVVTPGRRRFVARSGCGVPRWRGRRPRRLRSAATGAVRPGSVRWRTDSADGKC